MLTRIFYQVNIQNTGIIKTWNMGARFIQVPISDLRKLNPDIPESTLRELAGLYNGAGGNTTIDTMTYNEETMVGNYDSFLVNVVDAEWMSVNSRFRTTRKTQYGTELTYDEEYGKVFNTTRRRLRNLTLRLFTNVNGS